MPNVRTAAIAATLLATTCPLMAQTTRQSKQPPSASRQSLELEADSVYAAGNFERAERLFDQLAHLDSTSAKYWTQLGMSAAQAKHYAVGAHAFEQASALRAGPVAAYNAGAMFARLDQRDSAFAWLGRAVQTGFSDTTTLATDDDLASIRGDARFAKIRHDAANGPKPCRDDPNYHRFDFWIGNWRVTTAAGQQVGTSHVDVISGGCGLLENWRDMRGGEGKSLNTYDAAVGAWRQFWVGQSGGLTDYDHSEWHGSSLTFLSHARALNGGEVIQRLTFTPLDGGIVQQFGEASTDGGKTWGSSYDFRYHPVK